MTAFPMLAAVGRSKIRLVAATTSSTNQVLISAKAREGDLAVLFDASFNVESRPNTALPTGWGSHINDSYKQEVAGKTISGGRAIISSKILTAGDAGATVTGMDTNATVRKTLLVFRARKPIIARSAVDPKGYIGLADPDQRDLTFGANAPPAIVLAFAATANTGNGDVAFTVQTPPFEELVANTGNQITGYTIFQDGDAVPDQSFDMDDLSRNAMFGLYLQIAT
ncbi:hypothetical protein HW532_20840 [Kaustia mangrovi]|uniref:Uncharacterized protein n=1 Tax=Kaustia mangrovi TaxID=2593653 RepID=A0A7S8C7Q8_9HYPH|nr:hypothetical protein [Kaustia mangrovi]QPC44927.1 hypothetical protein HW532_20840 [Kaustia mangrovi]